MKKSKYIFAFLLLISTSIVYAQSSYETNNTRFGILAGLNFQNLNGKNYQGNKLENDMVTGFHIGVNAQIPIVPEFYFQPGLLLSTKGARQTDVSLTRTYNLSYLELPLNFVYKGALGNGHVMIGFGPYLGYGFRGSVSNDSNGSESYKENVKFQNVVELSDPLTTPYFKAIDLGGNVFAGYEMASGIFIQLNAQLGMVDINPQDNRLPGDQSALRNSGFGLSIGYRF